LADSYFTFDPRVQPICEIGMSDKRLAEPGEWLDVSCFVHEAELFRGRERFSERFEPGTASVTFDNRTGWVDLGGTYLEVAEAELRPGRQIRIGVRGPWDAGLAPYVRWLYRGFIDQATPTYDPVLHDVVTVNCIDALGESGSSTAPQGDHQGVNETVAQRINRVLDAVGWWGTKRKIDASVTTVQGTSLGQPAIDHMGQAADSAGGVVFGDLDGDVVFRDIDWMLYDPDTPPDDVIGPGPPGTGGGPGAPPYIDPTPGAVYDPDDPPAVQPPKVCVCADGTAGTLVEKGDNYRLYVKDGHLFYESSGTTWDMGPYSGGCTCVDPSPDGGGGPERSDDPDEDGDYDISPFPPIELPPQFAVELLNWNDGGLADPPAASVTVAGITPGHDCLLVALINALGTATNSTGLSPSITGGDLDWSHRRDADQASEGASSFIAVAPVGRFDPGTFDVTVAWTATSTSRSHIVTVWKVTAQAENYLARFDAGLVLYATTDSNPPDEIEPGNGPHSVELAADAQPANIDTLTRTVDIVIAQTLAEEDTGPFGATFADLDPAWIIPANVPGEAVVALIDTVWADDFERADGPLGANWQVGPGLNYYEAVHPLAINGGAAVGTVPQETGGTSPHLNMMQWVEEQGANQVIEVVMDNVWPNGEVQLYAHGNDVDSTCHVGYFFFSTAGGGSVSISLFHHHPDWSGALLNVSYPHAQTHPITCRLEADGDGTLRAYVDGVLAVTWSDPAPIVGPLVGVGFEYGGADPGGGLITGSPEILSVSGSSTGGVKKTSWQAGWRQGAASNVVQFVDVNTGPSDIQSAQACLVLESAETEAGWRILDYELRASTTGVTPAGVLTFNQAPRPGAMVVVFVGITASADVLGSVSVTGADFAAARTQPKTGSSWGQGVVYTAVAPLDLDHGSWAILVNYPACQSVSAVVYEVTDQDDEGPVGATASGVLGTNTAGSVNGADSITLSGAGDAAAVVLAYLHVAADPSPSSGATTVDGDEWHEELQYSGGGQRGYLQTMSRAPGQPESTSMNVAWADVQTGTAPAYSAVQLAVEIHPYDGLPPLTGGGSGVALGGVTDPWNGTINSAFGLHPVTGTPIWTFP
jgi:hypothetical protein